jgi:hypothetical protein
MSTAMISFYSANAVTSSSLNLTARFLSNVFLSLFLIFCLVLFAELWAEVVWDEFKYCREDPCCETHNASNKPMIAMKTTVSNFHCTATKLDYNALCYSNENEDDTKSRVVTNTRKDIQFIIDDSSIDDVKDAHDHKYIENI